MSKYLHDFMKQLQLARAQSGRLEKELKALRRIAGAGGNNLQVWAQPAMPYPQPQWISTSQAIQVSSYQEKIEVQTDLELSFSSEPIIGWRAWQIVDFERRGKISEKRLAALGVKWTWEPRRQQIAVCTTDGRHEVPWPSCHCGFWAFKDKGDVELAVHHRYGGPVGKAIGRVALGGRVLECTRGWRGELAYPADLTFLGVRSDTAAEIADLYGISYARAQETSFECRGWVREITLENIDLGYAYSADQTSTLKHTYIVTYEYMCGFSNTIHIKRDIDPRIIPPCPHHG